MTDFPDFPILSGEAISEQCRNRGLVCFSQAAAFVAALPYGRNTCTCSGDLTRVFTEGRGTCSTKHALLKKLARENGVEGLRLMLGIFRMNGENTPPVARTLQACGLPYLPEAHTYLRTTDAIADFTRPGARVESWATTLLREVEIRPEDIGPRKVRWHQSFLARWLAAHPEIPFSEAEIWRIREQCIADLSAAG